MQNIFFFSPHFEEKIWGGDRLSKWGYPIPSQNTGEAWCISAISEKETIITNGPHSGKTLAEVYDRFPSFFYGKRIGNKKKSFPLLIKLLDANQDLSIQVHPSDQYAQRHDLGEFGKTECWYVIEAPENAHLIYGTKANTREDLADKIKREEWNSLFLKKAIKAGDFIPVPAGKVHALTAGVMVLEIQQSSDTTFRIYDYGRRDAQGHLRDLHIEEAIQVITIPDEETHLQLRESHEMGISTTEYDMGAPFQVSRLTGKNAQGSVIEKNKQYQLFTVLNGSGNIQIKDDIYPFSQGDSFMIPAGVSCYKLQGTFEIFRSEEKLETL